MTIEKLNKLINFMLTQKLLHSSKKQLAPKQPYKKPAYKSYKELLHLDRPRKQIQYQSSSQDQDFLQKLLNEEKQQSKKKRRKSIKSGKRKLDLIGSDENKNINGQFKLLRNTQSRQKSAQKRNANELSLIQQQKNTDKLQPIVVKFNKESQTLPKNQTSPHKKSSIYIDNQSIQTPLILYTTTNQLFQNTLSQKRQTAFSLLLQQKNKFVSLYKPKENLDTMINGNKIQHNLDKLLQQKFQFRPNIEPIIPNWRTNLILHPKKVIPKRQFIDRKTLFKNQDEQERFVQSLRQISRKKH